MESGLLGCPSPVAGYSRLSGSFWPTFIPQDGTEVTSLTLVNTIDESIFLGHLCGLGVGARFLPKWVIQVGSRAHLTLDFTFAF